MQPFLQHLRPVAVLALFLHLGSICCCVRHYRPRWFALAMQPVVPLVALVDYSCSRPLDVLSIQGQDSFGTSGRPSSMPRIMSRSATFQSEVFTTSTDSSASDGEPVQLVDNAQDAERDLYTGSLERAFCSNRFQRFPVGAPPICCQYCWERVNQPGDEKPYLLGCCGTYVCGKCAPEHAMDCVCVWVA